MSALATLFQEVETAFHPTGVTLRETEESFVLEALTAGVKAKDLKISMENGSIHIEGKSERYCYSYLVPLPTKEIDDAAQIEAVTEDGILTIVLPKAKQLKPREITVRSV